MSFPYKYPAIASFYLLKISNKREPIKISIQFVCKLQSIIIPYTKVNHSIFTHHIHLYLYLLKHTLYMIAIVSFWQFDKTRYIMCFVSLPGDASYASFLTSQSPQATIACLMLAYSFSPKVRKYLLGSPICSSEWHSTSYRMETASKTIKVFMWKSKQTE